MGRRDGTGRRDPVSKPHSWFKEGRQPLEFVGSEVVNN